MTLRKKIMAVLAIPLLALVTSMAGMLVARVQTNEALGAERHAVALRATYEQVLTDLDDAETGTRGYVLTGKKDFLRPYTTGRAHLQADMMTLRGLVAGDATNMAEVDQLQVLANERMSILQSTQLLAPVTALTDRRQMIDEMSLGKYLMDQARALVSRDEAEAARLLQQRERGLDASRRISFLIGIVGTPFAVLASLLVILVFMQRLVARIRRTEENARRLEEGIPFDEASMSEDELGRLERMLVRSGTRVVELQAELRRQATVDPLTRLTNRRGFLPMAEHQLAIAKRTHQPVALLFADLDGLKSVNDSKGHAMGDSMITEAAYVMRQTFRASDLIARMGGDEFCILFAAGTESEAEAVISRMEATIGDRNAQEGRPFTLSVSTGLAFFDPERPCSLDTLISEADTRMYTRKRERSDTHAEVEPVA